MKWRGITVILILAVLLGHFSGGQNMNRAKAAGTTCYVDATATGSNDGSSWTNAYLDVQSALGDRFNPGPCTASGTEIHVAAGTYFPTSGNDIFATFQLFNGVKLVGGYPDGGGDTPDPSANLTILDGDIGSPGDPSDNSMHVITGGTDDPMQYPTLVLDSTTLLDGFTIANGRAAGDMAQNGGGIYISNGSPTLRNLVISGNETNGGGGGIYLFHSNSTLTDINLSSNGGEFQGTIKGGGIWNDGNDIAGYGSPVLTRVTFFSNTVTEGGGMYSTGGNPSLTDVNFIGNQADSAGGALYIEGGTLSLSDSLVGGSNPSDGNNSGDGAGIYVNAGSLAMQNTPVQNGIATNDGAGLFIASAASATIRGCNITLNRASFEGGGLYVQGSLAMVGGTVSGNNSNNNAGGIDLVGTGSADFVNLVVEQNTTMGVGPGTGLGGGINSDSSTARFTNLLLDRNSAAQGGGMALTNSTITFVNATIADNNGGGTPGAAIFDDNTNTLSIDNTIVWGNTNGSPSISAAASVTGSLLQDGCPSGADCTGVLSTDPLFVDPQAPDYRLRTISPAVDAGDASLLPADTYDLDGDGNVTERTSLDLRGKPRVAIAGVDIGEYEARAGNINWTEADTLTLSQTQPGVVSGSLDRYIDQQGQSEWFRFTVQPDSQLLVTLTNLGANYDLSLYTDITQAYEQLNSVQDLVLLSAEFAPDTFSPDTFSPDTFSPDTFSPDTFSPDTFSPDTFSPDTFSPDTFSPDTFSPDTFSPDTFSPDTFSPDTFSPDTFSPDTFSPDTFSPDTFSPDTFSPDTFSSAQTRSQVAFSAHDGTQGEGIHINTWTRSGYFYVRVKGRNGAFAPDVPFHLDVTLLNGTCGSVNPLLPAMNTSLTAGGYHTLILTNLAKTDGSPADMGLLNENLAALAFATNGSVVDVGADAQVSAAALQAQAHPACVYAMNLQAGAVKDIVDAFRKLNPDLEYIVLVGNDHAIPFFRYPDTALLASESQYSPPVLDNTTSQASLKSGYILSQDAYGSAAQVAYKADTLPVPDLAVGRLVETASDINHLLDAYLNHSVDGVVSPKNALVTGYDFLADDANAVRDQLQASLGSSAVDTLIMDNSLSPADKSAWTASDLRQSLLGSRHDVVFLAGHFSASSALAADYKTHLLASEVLASSTDFTNSLVYSAGCHSGYNIVNADGVPGVTVEPDWTQVFAQKGATFIGGTGYQYGDTDFIAYSEQLYLDFTQQLRYGSGPVAVGKALVQAKQAYIANTPLLRGIHEKSLLEATLFGLPMLQVDLPNRTSPPSDGSVVPGTTPFTSDPGQSLGLKFYNLHVTPAFTSHTVSLDQASGSPVTATYLEGPDGMVVNPAEPVLPLDMLNVSAPEAGYVLRGAGWRGGSFTDLSGLLPLTGAATEDLRATHSAFFSDTFYPVRPWNINYFDALTSAGGPTRLALIPAQYRSANPGSLTGLLRRFDSMDFRLYFSGNIESYTNAAHNWTNTPAQSAPPDISHITSIINPDGTVSFEVTVTGDPAAGIQEAWIVYTFENGSASGTWLPLDLKQDPDDTRLWKGSLDLGGNPTASLRFIVQAANGVGLVTMMTNDGAYYRAAVDPAVPPKGLDALTLTFDHPAASGPYGGQQIFSAVASREGAPVAGLPITLTLGGQGRLAVTDGNGRASANFFLLAQPGDTRLGATFNGNDTYTPADTSSNFTITPGASLVKLDPKTQSVAPGVGTQFSATVTSAGLPLAGKSVALTLDAGGVNQFTGMAVTDYAGKATWQLPGQSAGNYALKAWFGLPVSADLDLSSPYYTGSSDTASLSVVAKTDLRVTANDKTITYGQAAPVFDYTFNTSDFVNGHGAEDVSGITCSAGAGPFTHAGSPYPITCSGGSSPHYNLIYAPGTLTVNTKTLTVTPNPATSSAQYSDPNPSTFTPSYSGWVNGDGVASLTNQPTCSTARTANSPVGTYDITCSGGVSSNYTFAYSKGSFTVTQENAYLEYSGDSLALVGVNLNLRITVWDSAAASYPSTAANPETGPNATIGDITKMWVQFNIYPESTCGSSTTIAPMYAPVGDAPNTADGVGTASAVYESASGGSYCVIARLVAGNTGGVNQYYTGPSYTASFSVKTDLRVTANDKTITYGQAAPAFDYAFNTSDFVNGHGAEDVSGITCTAEAGPFTHAGSPYPITCSGGSSPHYNLIYAPGTLTVNAKTLTVTPNPATSSAQYSDPNPSAFTPSYSGWVNGDGVASLTTQPACSTARTVASPAGTYDIICSGGAGANYTLSYVKGTFSVPQENAYLEYSGDSLALVNTNLNLRVSAWDSAASGYPASAANPESKPNATIGDITKMWVQFNIYPEATCGTSTSIAPIYAQVVATPGAGAGIGSASAVYKSTTEASYCVIARLVAGNTGGTNGYYTAPDAQSAAISFYQNLGKFASGGGWIKDPNSLAGIFSFIARNDSKGKPTGQLMYTYLGTYNGIPAVFIIRSGQLTSLQFTGANYPLTMTMQGKCTIQVIRALGGAALYSDASATFKAVALDTNKNPGSNTDSFALTVWDKSGKAYKTVPTSKLILGNVVIKLK